MAAPGGCLGLLKSRCLSPPRFFCLSVQNCWEQPIILSIMEIIPFKATGAFFFGGVGGGGMQALLRSLHKILRLGYVRDARPRLEPSGEAASLWGAWRYRVPSLSLLFK